MFKAASIDFFLLISSTILVVDRLFASYIIFLDKYLYFCKSNNNIDEIEN